MLHLLRIKNLILIDYEEISFSEGLNILTGESGSGKSAILSALGLILGRKAQQELIREGEPSAWVEALFTLSKDVHEILEEENISFVGESRLSIRREISRNGKSRCFIQDQLVSLASLKKMGASLCQMADQNSHEDLGSETYQRTLLGKFAGISEKEKAFEKNYQKEKLLEKNLQELILRREKEKRDKEIWEKDLQEIEESKIKEGEEEEISKEHHLLTHAAEIREKTDAMYGALQDPLLSRLAKIEQISLSCALIHPRLKEVSDLLKGARLELQEAAHLLQHTQGLFERDPEKLSMIEERLKQIEILKRKHGSLSAIEEKKKEIRSYLDAIASSAEKIEEIQETLIALKKENDALCLFLREKRKAAAPALAKKVSEELASLNLGKAQFQIEIEPASRTSFGEDKVLFLFSANEGSPKPVGHVASGGELSRLLLAFHMALAEKTESSSLIFDEIDANVGGKSAVMIGEKLQALSKFSQILSVTHFIQVAKCAHAHFLVKKEEKMGRIVTRVEKLSEKAREEEFQRMVGEPI